ncbi:putative serine/threonine-protein kinase isoform X2 [Juglans microcarpa x Juglans regia]|uniref:putative serine/threonine-protein kinase isoform X2 n=1 Tax=Juglans microcarpa x Juglans regia TaxID=2249226 RepID=UPI001B7EEE62|nr:putative serine/threonine-protein kinase isoform X2 [Juglans microcarpa x Juglans regia]
MKLSACTSCFSSSSGTDVSRHEQDQGNFRVFSYNELKSATTDFHHSKKIGEGGFGSVYKGRLRDGSFVAVKVLSIELDSMRGEREFIAEIASLSDIKHENLVTLRGCCVDGAKRYVVYDYMENNSLAHILHGGDQQKRLSFSWEARRDISLGVARALSFLLEEVEPHIIHRDIKASNILLDKNFTPKVSDFGLSKLLRDNHTHVSTRVAGTLGYLAPEYAISGHLTRKSDVYSFGVLLLEIVSGRPAVDFRVDYKDQLLVQKAWEAYEAKELINLADPKLETNFPEEEAVRFLKVGLLCAQENVRLRPLMSAVVKMLTSETDLQDVQISEPGKVSDFMNIRTQQTPLSEGSSTSSGMSNMWSSVNLGR